jgi:hypothetical protein
MEILSFDRHARRTLRTSARTAARPESPQHPHSTLREEARALPRTGGTARARIACILAAICAFVPQAAFAASSSGGDSDASGTALVAAIVVAAIVAGGIVVSEYRAMKTAHTRSEATEYLENGSLHVLAARDDFVTANVVATPLPRADDHDGDGPGFGGSPFDGGPFGGVPFDGPFGGPDNDR